MLDTLAHAADPYPTYAALRDQGVHQHDDGRWVVARADDVAALLSHPAAVVGFPGTGVQASMARFSDGDDHTRRRAMAEARLATITPESLRTTAAALTRRRLAGIEEVDVMGAVARYAPVGALAVALGATDVERAVEVTRELALAMAPPLGTGPGDVAGAAALLAEVLGHEHLDEGAINVAALLFQTVDATAGLIGNALLARTRLGPVPTEMLVTETVRSDPPVQLTTRLAAAPVEIGGVTIPAGARIVVLLAAATFGTGLRPCPGEAHALALATGVLDALAERDATPITAPVTYEPRPNLRIPSRLVARLA